MDKETTDAAFWDVVKATNTAEEQDRPLSINVPQIIHRIFDAGQHHLLTCEKLTTNVICMHQTNLPG